MVKIHFLRSQIIENDVESSFPNVVLMLFALNGYTSIQLILPSIETPFFVFLILPKLFRGNMIIGEGWIGLIKINVFVVVTSCCESLCNSPRNNNFCGHKTTLMPKHTTIVICFKVYLYF